MKRIAIISSQYFWLPTEAGPTRFFSIAKEFFERGYEVEIITSSFEHHEKKQRNKSLPTPFKTIYLDCPSYKKNIGVGRVISNAVFSRKIRTFLNENGKKYDAVYCSLPPNNISAVAAKYCFENNIPFIADIEDLWPEAMNMVVPGILKFLFHSFKKDAEKTYKYVDAVVGTSEEYSLRASKYNDRSIPYKTVYVGCDISEFDKEAEENLQQVSRSDGEIWVTYAGSIGYSYAIDNIVRAAKLLQDMGEERFRFKILGSGPLKDETEQLSKDLGCNNIEFTGYLPHPLMAAYLVRSDVLINSFAKGASQSIVNKIGDYLAAGKPIVNTLENKEMQKLIHDHEVGINVHAEDPEALVKAIKKVFNNEKMMKNSRKLAEEKFDRKTSYKEISELVSLIMKERKG